jgi:ATP-dependent helicase HrpA
MLHLPRYLRAMRIRSRKARENPVRDAERARPIDSLEKRIADLVRAGRIGPALSAELAAMLEELRVSVFAQELGTASPVSVKRIERRLEAAPA